MDARRARFEAQVLPHLEAAYRFARWLAHSRTDAEDIVQDAVLRAFRGFEGLRSGDARAWLLSIVRNCHANAYQQHKRRAAVPLPEEGDAQSAHVMVASEPDPESLTMQRDDERTFERLLGELSQEHREVLALRELEEMSYREIAEVTSLPVGTVMSRLARARTALKELWLKETEGEPSGVR
jgi:RNA polymerase sigma-70 factor (ECF subfamily)